MTTATKIIRGALDQLGVRGAGQNVDGTLATELLGILTTMVDAMNLGPTFSYTDVETVVSLPANVSSLTIGPAMQINIQRPARIETSSFIRVGTLDYPLVPIDHETYNDIVLKVMNGPWPEVCYWDGGNPTGNLYFWPQGACSVHLVTSAQVANFADLTTDYALPNGYERMFIFSLAEEAAATLETQVPPQVMKIAQSARRAVRRNNLTVPQLAIPQITDCGKRYILTDFIAGL